MPVSMPQYQAPPARAATTALWLACLPLHLLVAQRRIKLQPRASRAAAPAAAPSCQVTRAPGVSLVLPELAGRGVLQAVASRRGLPFVLAEGWLREPKSALKEAPAALTEAAADSERAVRAWQTTATDGWPQNALDGLMAWQPLSASAAKAAGMVLLHCWARAQSLAQRAAAPACAPACKWAT